MTEDERCCGTGTCIINADGECWCGQRWDGEKMCFPTQANATASAAAPGNSAEPATGQPRNPA